MSRSTHSFIDENNSRAEANTPPMENFIQRTLSKSSSIQNLKHKLSTTSLFRRSAPSPPQQTPPPPTLPACGCLAPCLCDVLDAKDDGLTMIAPEGPSVPTADEKCHCAVLTDHTGMGNAQEVEGKRMPFFQVDTSDGLDTGDAAVNSVQGHYGYCRAMRNTVAVGHATQVSSVWFLAYHESEEALD